MKYVVDPADCRLSLMVDRTLQVHKIQYVICYGYISLDFVSFHSKIILVICLRLSNLNHFRKIVL